MRTTLTIDDDLLVAAKSLARDQRRTLGEVISDLTRKGLAPSTADRQASGFPAFALPEEAHPITPEMVARALDEE